MTSLELVSTSRAQDAAYLALNDLAALASRIGGDYRIIGGHMVTLLVAASGATGVPDRETADADFGAPFSVIRDRRLLDELYNRGYRQTGAANRFERNIGDLPLTIDVLAPSYSGRHEPNQAHGELVVDEIPGLGYALAQPARQITAGVRLTDGAEITTRSSHQISPRRYASRRSPTAPASPTRTRLTCGESSKPPTPNASPPATGQPGRHRQPPPRYCTVTSPGQTARACAGSPAHSRPVSKHL